MPKASILRKFAPLASTVMGLLLVGLALIQLGVIDRSTSGIYAALRTAGSLAPLAFLGFSLVRGLLFVPAGTFTVVAGIVFGPIAGALYALIGVGLSALLPFMLARRLGGHWVHEFLEEERGDPRFLAAVDLVRDKGFWGIALLRTLPFPPFDAISYAGGILPVRGIVFLLGTILGSVPGVIIFSFLGAELRRPFGPVFFVLLGLIAAELIFGYHLVRLQLIRSANDRCAADSANG